MLVVAPERRIVGAVDLVEVEVGCGGAGGGLGLAVGVGVDGVDEVVERSSWSEPMSITPMPSCVSSTVTALFGRMSVQWATGSTWPVLSACSSSGGRAKS